MSITLTPATVTALILGIFLLGLIAGIAVESRRKRKKKADNAQTGSVRITVEQQEAGKLTLEVMPATAITPPQHDASTASKIIVFVISILLGLLLLSMTFSNPPPNEFQYKKFIPIAAQHP